MIKKLNVLAAAAFFTVAAVSSTQAAPAAITGATVLQHVNFALQVYSQDGSGLNHAGTADTNHVKISSLTTAELVKALTGGPGSLLKYTDYATSNTGVEYSVAASTVVGTNSYPDLFSTNLTSTNVEFLLPPFVVGGVTNTNTTVTSFYITNGVGGSNTFAGTGFTNYTVVSFLSNSTTFTVTGTGYEVVSGSGRNATVTILTNLTEYYPGITNSTGTAYYPEFSGIVTETNDYDFLQGNEKVIGGVTLTDDVTGTGYSAARASINAPGWFLNLGGFETTAYSNPNLGTAKAPVYVSYGDSTVNAYGTGYMGGTQTTTINTNVTPNVTNAYIAGATQVLVKGTVSVTFDSITTTR